jgi:hypothetical protein
MISPTPSKKRGGLLLLKKKITRTARQKKE